jgi:hypothetical protein
MFCNEHTWLQNSSGSITNNGTQKIMMPPEHILIASSKLCVSHVLIPLLHNTNDLQGETSVSLRVNILMTIHVILISISFSFLVAYYDVSMIIIMMCLTWRLGDIIILKGPRVSLTIAERSKLSMLNYPSFQTHFLIYLKTPVMITLLRVMFDDDQSIPYSMWVLYILMV